MHGLDVAFYPISIRSASLDEYAALAYFNNQVHAERFPDDPPQALEQYLGRWQNIPDFVDVSVVVARRANDSTIVARASVTVWNTDTNQHLAQCLIDVLPEFRRQGIGRQLLSFAAETAQRSNRRVLQGETYDHISAGAAFAQRFVARKGMEFHTNQLRMAELDANLVRRWQDGAAERAAEFVLGEWDGPYPEDELPAIVALNDVMNSAPRDDLDLEDEHFTPEQLRQFEQATFAAGTQRWTLYVRHRTTGAFAGFTEVYWNPRQPELLDQGSTGVFPEYRNCGLGRWLKAAMLTKIMKEHPEIKYVRTGNADSNVPMLRINTELGFKPYVAQCVWQVDVDQVLSYLAQSDTHHVARTRDQNGELVSQPPSS